MTRLSCLFSILLGLIAAGSPALAGDSKAVQDALERAGANRSQLEKALENVTPARRRGLEFLLGFGGDNLQELLNADDYLSFTIRFIAVFGVAFLFPVFLFAAAAAGVVDSARLRSGRRWAVTLIVVIGAVVTPSGDPLTLMLLSTPLYILYEFTILAIRFVLRR